jgi:hypothetical protein
MIRRSIRILRQVLSLVTLACLGSEAAMSDEMIDLSRATITTTPGSGRIVHTAHRILREEIVIPAFPDHQREQLISQPAAVFLGSPKRDTEPKSFAICSHSPTPRHAPEQSDK